MHRKVEVVAEQKGACRSCSMEGSGRIVSGRKLKTNLEETSDGSLCGNICV